MILIELIKNKFTLTKLIKNVFFYLFLNLLEKMLNMYIFVKVKYIFSYLIL